MKEIYGWVPWFRKLAQNVAEGGKHFLIERAKKVAWNQNGDSPKLLQHGDENIDPFSFVNYIASRSGTAANRARIYPSVNEFLALPIWNTLISTMRSFFRRHPSSMCCSMTRAPAIRICSGTCFGMQYLVSSQWTREISIERWRFEMSRYPN